MITILILWLFLGNSSAVVCRGGVTDLCPQDIVENQGSVTLHFEDNTNHPIVIRPGDDCWVTNLPNKKITKVEVAAENFVLYGRKNFKGTEKRVNATGSREFSRDYVGFPKVKSAKQIGCETPKRKASGVELVAIGVCLVLVLVLATVLVYRRRKNQAITVKNSTSVEQSENQEFI